MKNITSILVCSMAALVILLTGCTPIYNPTVENVPLFSSKGDVSVGFYGGTSGKDLQAAYAVTDHFAVMVNGSYEKTKPQADTLPDNYQKHIFGEVGAGYFTKIGRSGRFETFGGFGTGYGYAENKFYFISPVEVYAKGYYNRYFLQTTCGASSELFDGGLSLRGSYVNFYRYSHSETDYDQSNNQFLLEPVIFGRVGWKMVKFQTQIGLSIPLGDINIGNYQILIFNLGLVCNLNVFGKNNWAD